jgi:hypothetical protein
MRLGRRKRLLVAVDGAAGRDEQHLPHPCLARRLEQGDGAEDVGPRVEERVGHRPPHVHLRGVVVQHVGALIADQVGRPRVEDVQLVEPRLRIQVLALSRAQVVDHQHVVARRDAGVDDVRADEARAAGDEDLHQTLSRK